MIIPLHLVLSGHWGIIFDHTSPFGTIRSLRYNIWSYLSIWYYQVTEVQYLTYLSNWYYQVTEVQYLTIPLHLVLSGHWGTIFDQVIQYLHFHLVLSGHWGTIFDHTSPFGTIRSLRYNIWSYLSIWYYQVTEVQYLIISNSPFDPNSPFGAIRSLRYNIWQYLSICCYQVTEV